MSDLDAIIEKLALANVNDSEVEDEVSELDDSEKNAMPPSTSIESCSLEKVVGTTVSDVKNEKEVFSQDDSQLTVQSVSTDDDFGGQKIPTEDDESEIEKVVSFAGNGWKLDTEEDAAKIIVEIKNCSSMTTLCLEGNTIGAPAAKAIGKALESQPKLRKAFWKDMFTQRTEYEIPDALVYLSSGITLANAQLTILDLSDNAFGPRGLKGIIELLRSPPCYTLKELYFNNNGLGTSGAKMLAFALADCLTNSRRAGKALALEVFICGRNRLENEGCAAIAKVLKDIGTFVHIAMPQNGIYYEGIEILSQNLVGMSSLKHLNLEDNCFTMEGAREMAKTLCHLKHIEILNFDDCLMRSEGAKEIAKTLQQNCPELRELHLGYNEMNLSSGREIIQALVGKEHLEKLVLNGNQFGESGCIKIKKFMGEIGLLNILGSLIDDEGTDNEDDSGENGDVSENSVEYPSDFKGNVALEFICKPTIDKLTELHESKIVLTDELPEKLTLSDCFDLFVATSSLLDPGDNKTNIAGCYVIDSILSCAFEMSSATEMWKFNSDFLIHLGLVKREDHTMRIVQNYYGAFTLLTHALNQSYFHQSTKDLLKFFLSKPFKWDDVTSKAKALLSECLNETIIQT